MDELEALREFFSTPEPLSPIVVQRHKEMLMSHIESSSGHSTETPTPDGAAGVHTAGRRRSRSRRIAAMVAIPVVAVALAAAGWAALRTEATAARSYSCDADDVVTIMANHGDSPITACADLWASGRMITDVTEVPPLVGCIDGTGTVHVIEGHYDAACATAGMAPWAPDPSYAAAGEAVRAALITFHDRYRATGDSCITVDDWRQALEEQPGTHGWHTTVDQIEASRHCYDVDVIDPTTRTIGLIGVPGDDSIGCDPRTGC